MRIRTTLRAVAWSGMLFLYPGPYSGLPAQEPADTVAAGVSFDFQDADIRLVLTSLAQAGGISIVYGALPDRTVTLRTNGPVPHSDIRTLMESIARANELILVEEGDLIRVESAGPVAGLVDPSAAPPSDLRLFVYRLKHARAARLAGTLQALFGGGSTGGVANGLSREGLSSELRDTRIAPGIPGATGPQPGAQEISGRVAGAVQVVPDELTNALLIRASEQDWQVVRQAIEALDLRPLQVLIEVLIAEVRRSTNFDLGVSVEVPDQREPRTGALIGGELVGAGTGDIALRIMDLGAVDADVLLSALSARSDVSIVSRPVVLAQNNQEARILVGSERPFVQVFRALPTDAAVRDQVVQYRDVGTSLTIRPTINYDGYVSLDVLQEVSTATNEIQFGAPVISTREAATRLLVKNDQTVVIGGLIDRQQERGRSGIPILKDIPLLGALFGSTQRNDVQTELFVFLTPHIIEDDADADRLKRGIDEGAELLDRLEVPRAVLPADTLHVQPDSLPPPPY